MSCGAKLFSERGGEAFAEQEAKVGQRADDLNGFARLPVHHLAALLFLEVGF